MTPEGRVKAAIDKLLKDHKAYFHKPVQNGMGAPALDYWVCHEGRFIAIEAKAPGAHMTDRQVITGIKIEAAGGSVLCINSTTGDDLYELEKFFTERGRMQCFGPNWTRECNLYNHRRGKK